MLERIGVNRPTWDSQVGDPDRIPRGTPTDVTDVLTEEGRDLRRSSYVSNAREQAKIIFPLAAYGRLVADAPGGCAALVARNAAHASQAVAS
jgi:hypothetical protein